MKLLPSQILKLRWLLSQKEKMADKHDADYIVDISKFLALKNNPDEVHPITALMIDSLYDKYEKDLRGKHVRC